LYPHYTLYSGTNYTKFENFSDTITNYEYINSSYLIDDIPSIRLDNTIFFFNSSLSITDYQNAPSYHDEYLSITKKFQTTNTNQYFKHQFNQTLSYISLKFYMYVNIADTSSRQFAFADNSGNVFAAFKIITNHLHSYSSSGWIEEGFVFSESNWYLIEIYLDNTSHSFYTWINNVQRINRTAHSGYNLQLWLNTVSAITIFYLANIMYESNIGKVYFVDWNNYVFGMTTALSIPLQTNEYINFTNPNPINVWGYNQSFYFACDFDYIANIEYVIDFSVIKYKLRLNSTHFIIESIENNIVIETFSYAKISNINQNVRFIISFNYNYNTATRFSLMYGNYIYQFDKAFSTGHQPQSHCQGIYFKALTELTLILKNMLNIGWVYSNTNFQILNNPNLKTSSTQALESYTVNLPPFGISDDYILVSNYFLSSNVSQIANITNVLSRFTYQPTPIILEVVANGVESIDFNATFQPTSIYVEIFSSENILLQHHIYLETYILYYLKTSDVLNIFISFIPSILILVLFPMIFFDKFKKWGVLIGLFCSIIVLGMINNFSIVQILLLLSIVTLLIVYLLKKQKGQEINDF
jgi:hypothetical protein